MKNLGGHQCWPALAKPHLKRASIVTVSHLFPNHFWKHVTLVLPRKHLPSSLMKMLNSPLLFFHPAGEMPCWAGKFFFLSGLIRAELTLKCRWSQLWGLLWEKKKKSNICIFLLACLRWEKTEEMAGNWEQQPKNSLYFLHQQQQLN